MMVYTSEHEYNHLSGLLQDISRREKELRHMMEIRQAWGKFSSLFEQRLVYLNAMGQPQPQSMYLLYF
jgi:hypothetical protein